MFIDYKNKLNVPWRVEVYVSGVRGCLHTMSNVGCMLSSAEQNKTKQQQQGVDPGEEGEQGLAPAGLNQLQSQAQVLPISHPLQPATQTQPHLLHIGHSQALRAVPLRQISYDLYLRSVIGIVLIHYYYYYYYYYYYWCY